MTIYGNDDRLAITTTASTTPFSAYLQVAAQFSDGTILQSSGVMVGPNDVLTAANAIFSQAHGGWATNIQVTPGRYGDLKPFGVHSASQISAPLAWQNSSDLSSDYGLLSLATDIGYVTGWVETGYAGTLSGLSNYTLSTLGYPTDQGGNTLYYSSGSVDQVVGSGLIFTDDLDMMAGQNGSPVVFNSGGVDIVLGLAAQVTDNAEDNRVLALTAESFQTIQTWMADNTTEPVLSGLNPSFTGLSHSTDLQIVRLVELLFNQQPGYAVLESYRKVALSSGIDAVATTMISSQAPFSENSFVVSQIITSTQLTGGAATAAEDYLNNLLNSATTEAERGKVVLDAGNALAGLTDNLTFGSYAVSFNTEVTNALAYSVVPMHSEVNTVEAVVSGASLLTTDWMLLS
jgi:V8-like Glu-specific endopeptidase